MDIQYLRDNNLIIYEVVAGSHAYGLATKDSDIDIRGVFIAPQDMVLSCYNTVEHVSDEKQDIVYYELRKFLKLAADSNPNIIELLFMPDDCIRICTPEMQKILDKKDIFLSKKAKHTFSGYAYSQLNKIKGHNKWIMNPCPEKPPSIDSYCTFIDTCGKKKEINTLVLSDTTFLVDTFDNNDKNILRVFYNDDFAQKGWFNNDLTDIRTVVMDDDEIEETQSIYMGCLIVNHKLYSDDIKKWKQYWDWVKNRNPKRSDLEKIFGFDTKHAMHLVRLIRSCEEILTTGKISIRRDADKDDLLSIRSGGWSYDMILDYARDMDNKLVEIYDKSNLPHTADYVSIDKLYREILRERWFGDNGYRQI